MAETRVVITAEANQAIQEFERLRAQATGSLQALGGASNQLNRTTVSAAQTAAALRQVPAQFTDIVVSLQAGQAPLTVLLQQGGQLRDMFGSASGAAKALGGYVLGLINPVSIAAASVGVLAYAYHEGSKETDAYNKALVMSGNVAGTTAGQMADMARNISKSVGTQGQAAEVLAELAGTGKVAAGNMEEFTKTALMMEKVVGRSAAETVKDLSELGKAPLEASLKLNEQYHFLTAATYAQIKALEDQGKTEDAAAIAQKAYSEAMDGRSNKLIANLGLAQRAWAGLASVAKGAWDAMLDVGREDTLQQKLAKVQVKIKKGQAPFDPSVGGNSEDRMNLKKNQAEEASLKAQIDAESRLLGIGAERQKLNEADLKWRQEGEKYLTKRQQMEREITLTKQQGLDAGVSDAEIDKRVTEVKKKYADLNNAGLAALEAQRALEREVLAGRLADLESGHRQGIVSDEVYVAQKRDIQLKDLDGEAAILKKQADLASGKADLTERTKYLGGLAVIEQRRKNIIKESQDAIAEYAQAGSKAVKDQVATWSTATAAQVQSLQDEISLYGKSAEARSIATAQMKIDSDVRTLIADKIKQKHPLNERELADLKAEAEQYKTNIAAILGQRQALAGAEQLRKENEKFSVESIADEQQRAAGLLEIDARIWRERIGMAVAGSEAQKKLQGEFDVWYANRQMAPVLDRWKGIISNLDNNFQQGFRDMLTSGQGTWKSFSTSIANTLKTSLADALYQTFIKKYVVQIVASMAGTISGPAVASALSGQGAGGDSGAFMNMLGGTSSIYSIGKMIYSGFSAGITSTLGSSISSMGSLFGSEAVSAFGAGMSGGALGASTASAASGYAGTSAAGAGASAAGAIPIIGWIIAGMQAAAGFRQQGFDPNNGTTSLMGKVAGAVPLTLNKQLQQLGMGSALANILTGASINTKLFGRANPVVEHQGLEGTISAGGIDAHSYADILEKGGWFRSDKRYTKTLALDATNDGAFDSTIQAMVAAVKGFGKAIGVEASQIDRYTKSFKLELTGDDTKNQELIAKLFGDVGNELSIKLVPAIESLSVKGETASTTLQRVVTDYSAIDGILASIGKTFGTVGMDSLAARENLISFAGGVDALASGTAGFAQNYLTEAERLAPVTKAVDKAMEDLGLSSIKTIDQFKEYIIGHRQADGTLTGGLDMASEAGQKMFAALIGVQDAFFKVHSAADGAAAATRSAADIANERAGLQTQLDSLTLTSSQLLTKQRDALDTSNRSLFDQIQAAQAAKDATAAQASAAQSAADAIKAARESSLSVYASFGSEMQSTIEKINSATQALREFSAQINTSDLSPLSGSDQYAASKIALRSATQDTAQSAVTEFLKSAQSHDASQLDYSRDVAYAQSVLQAIIGSSSNRIAGTVAAYSGIFKSLSAAGIGAHANGGIASGMSLVGEQGPELIDFAQPARVYTASQSRQMLGGDSSELKAEIKLMREQISGLLSQVVVQTKRGADNSKVTADVLDAAQNGRPLATAGV